MPKKKNKNFLNEKRGRKWKTYKIDEKDDLISIDASKITWKNEDKNPTIKMKKKPIKKGKKVIKKNVKQKVDSFFNFFKSFEKKNEK